MRKQVKRLFVASLLISSMCLGLLCGCGGKDDKAKVAGAAPDFSLTDTNGNRVESANLRGKVVFLHFWATWCKYCVHEIPDLNELYADYGKRGVVFLAVSLDDGSLAVKALQQKIEIDYPIAMGTNDTVKDFGNFRGLPSTFIITPDWKIYKHIRGYVPKEQLEQALDEALKK